MTRFGGLRCFYAMKAKLLVAALAALPGGARAERCVRATVSSGVAIALADYETHGAAFPIRAGVALALRRVGTVRHELVVAADYAHFSRKLIRAPEPIPGARLDVGAAGATWRVFPLPARGLHVDAGAGVSALRDRIQVALPDRRITSSETRAGLALGGGLGWVLGRRVDVGLHYAHVLLAPRARAPAAALGRLELSVGVQL